MNQLELIFQKYQAGAANRHQENITKALLEKLTDTLLTILILERFFHTF